MSEQMCPECAALGGWGVCECQREDTIAALTRRAEAAEADRAHLACDVSDLLLTVERLERERDEYRVLSNKMHRRAQEAERLLGLAMRVGQAECEAMRARMQSAEREVRALTGPGRVVEAETWLRDMEGET